MEWDCRCTAQADNLDGEGGRQSHELTLAAMAALDLKTLWEEYGIVSDLMPFTYAFPFADIHELIAVDVFHQIIKGTFKDHLVTWVEDYIKLAHTAAQRRFWRISIEELQRLHRSLVFDASQRAVASSNGRHSGTSAHSAKPQIY